jgi:hypothetical protein
LAIRTIFSVLAWGKKYCARRILCMDTELQRFNHSKIQGLRIADKTLYLPLRTVVRPQRRTDKKEDKQRPRYRFSHPAEHLPRPTVYFSSFSILHLFDGAKVGRRCYLPATGILRFGYINSTIQRPGGGVTVGGMHKIMPCEVRYQGMRNEKEIPV